MPFVPRRKISISSTSRCHKHAQVSGLVARSLCRTRRIRNLGYECMLASVTLDWFDPRSGLRICQLQNVYAMLYLSYLY